MAKDQIIPVEAVRGITLLTRENARSVPQSILEYPYCWWLRSPGKHVTNVATVCYFGCVLTRGHSVTLSNYAVRPVLEIEEAIARDWEIGDIVSFADKQWQYIGDNLILLHGEPLTCMAFHHDADEYEHWDDAEKYEKSDVCRFLQSWLQEQKDAR